jgi:hypothetical protein
MNRSVPCIVNVGGRNRALDTLRLCVQPLCDDANSESVDVCLLTGVGECQISGASKSNKESMQGLKHTSCAFHLQRPSVRHGSCIH